MYRRRTFVLVSLVANMLITAVPLTAAGQHVVRSAKPAEPTADCTNVVFGGEVTEITKSTISIRWLSENKPKKFLLSETLAAGKVPMKPRIWSPPHHRVAPGGYHVDPQLMYRLADVKVGDLVVIAYAHLGGIDFCDHISIRKRPGGRVPPLPEEAEKLLNPEELFKSAFPGTHVPRPKDWQYIPYHEKMNARWDLQDKGIPFPEKFGANRRFPVAPMPRAAGPIGPLISP